MSDLTHVLIVNDSLSTGFLLKRLLTADPRFSPVTLVTDGVSAEKYVHEHDPDVILMDIRMPGQSGIETIRNIMAFKPVPILVVTATLGNNMSEVFQCFHYGALDAILPPRHPEFRNIHQLSLEKIGQIGADFIKKVWMIAGLKSRVGLSGLSRPEAMTPEKKTLFRSYRMIAVGASTGGPAALSILLQSFPAEFTVPIVIVQHMDFVFLQSLTKYLQGFSKLPVKLAENGHSLDGGTIYLAGQEKAHLQIQQGRFQYTTIPQSIHMPSVDVFFNSVAESYGPHAIGLLLTGMGNDGAAGLKHMQVCGGWTVAQDEKSSAIYGMPKAAVELNACRQVLPLTEIGPEILKLISS
ncbi:MAG: response regulator [SAR324 cluster bacterium]|nr:response regulator [SAR324 cluster bacterium]